MLEKEMVKLGLSDKEAKVYLASLELGPSSVQTISQKAKVNRATTYVIIDSLMGMGLMSTFDENKKTFFAAEKPSRLLDIIKNQEQAAKDKLKILEERMPELKSLFNSSDKPIVKYYEGVEGLRAVQMDFVETLSSGEEIYTFLPFDDYFKSNLKDKVDDIREKRYRKGIKMKIIYTSKNGEQKDYVTKEDNKMKRYKFIDYKKYPFSGGMNVYGNKVFMIDYLGKTGGIVIENKTLADMMRAFFEMSWNCLK